jgi:hypothetical protein
MQVIEFLYYFLKSLYTVNLIPWKTQGSCRQDLGGSATRYTTHLSSTVLTTILCDPFLQLNLSSVEHV